MPPVFVSMAGKIERPTYVPSQTYASGVYSNGPVWAAAHEIIADAFVLAAVPEPSTWVMMFVGFACVGFVAYRHRQQPPATLRAA